MPQKTLNGEDVEEDSLWSEGSFIETMGPESKHKMRTFHMKHNEEMNYNCKECNTKISAHNKDWHARRCDTCFERYGRLRAIKQRTKENIGLWVAIIAAILFILRVFGVI